MSKIVISECEVYTLKTFLHREKESLRKLKYSYLKNVDRLDKKTIRENMHRRVRRELRIKILEEAISNRAIDRIRYD